MVPPATRLLRGLVGDSNNLISGTCMCTCRRTATRGRRWLHPLGIGNHLAVTAIAAPSRRVATRSAGSLNHMRFGYPWFIRVILIIGGTPPCPFRAQSSSTRVRRASTTACRAPCDRGFCSPGTHQAPLQTALASSMITAASGCSHDSRPSPPPSPSTASPSR